MCFGRLKIRRRDDDVGRSPVRALKGTDSQRSNALNLHHSRRVGVRLPYGTPTFLSICGIRLVRRTPETRGALFRKRKLASAGESITLLAITRNPAADPSYKLSASVPKPIYEEETSICRACPRRFDLCGFSQRICGSGLAHPVLQFLYVFSHGARSSEQHQS